MLTVLDDRVLVEVLDNEEKTACGIIIPDEQQVESTKGKVVAVGRGKVTESGKIVPPQVKVGHVVMFSKYGINSVSVKGKDYKVMCESDIIGIMGDEK